jgi:3'-phosphoadenosine 5'-phosphosulfate sulfotransferase (PAPS reductase)/FAD synthetase
MRFPKRFFYEIGCTACSIVNTGGIQDMTKARRQSKIHIDKERVQLQKDAERIIHSGTLVEFKEMLRHAGIDPESAKGKGFIDRLIRLGASGRSPQ